MHRNIEATRLELKDTEFKGDLGGAMPIEVKELTEDGQFEGYASVYGVVDQGGDIVARGAFDETIKSNSGRVRMLYQHNPSQVIGKWLEISSDKKGLLVKGKLLTGVSLAKDVLELMRNGAIDGMSIGFRTIDAKRDGEGIRTILKAELWEISIVSFPMNRQATVSGVKNAGGIKTIREFEGFLRDAGFSRAQAAAIATGGFKATEPRDEDVADQLADPEVLTSLDRLAATLRGA